MHVYLNVKHTGEHTHKHTHTCAYMNINEQPGLSHTALLRALLSRSLRLCRALSHSLSLFMCVCELKVERKEIIESFLQLKTKARTGALCDAAGDK